VYFRHTRLTTRIDSIAISAGDVLAGKNDHRPTRVSTGLVRLLGYIIPAVFLLLFTYLALAGAGRIRTKGIGLRLTAVAISGLRPAPHASGTPRYVSTRAGYAVPWRKTPDTLNFRGRTYYHEGCALASKDAKRVGWVYGYFMPWQPLYAERFGAFSPSVPGGLWIEGDTNCVPFYGLSGGP